MLHDSVRLGATRAAQRQIPGVFFSQPVILLDLALVSRPRDTTGSTVDLVNLGGPAVARGPDRSSRYLVVRGQQQSAAVETQHEDIH